MCICVSLVAVLIFFIYFRNETIFSHVVPQIAIQTANLQIQKMKSGPNIQRTEKNTWSLALILLKKDVDHDCGNAPSGKNIYPLSSPVVSANSIKQSSCIFSSTFY